MEDKRAMGSNETCKQSRLGISNRMIKTTIMKRVGVAKE
jgi:hypothetical protein